MTRFSNREMTKNPCFLFLCPSDPYFLKIHALLLDSIVTLQPNSSFVFWPLYGIKHDEPTPKSIREAFRRHLHAWKEYKRIREKVRNCFTVYSKSFLHAETNGRISFVSPTDWAKTIFSSDSTNCSHRDLVLDTYIRFKPSPDHSEDDYFWRKVIHRASRFQSLCDELLYKLEIKAVIGSYCSYIYHGIPHRRFTANGIHTVTFGNSYEFCKIHSPFTSFPLHTRSHWHYKHHLNMTADEALFISKQAENSLNKRLNGEADESVPYMKKRQNLELSISDIGNDYVIFLHDFFDSVHIYRWTLFDSHYEWAFETIRFLENNNIRVHVKPHPNASDDSKKALLKLKNSFKNSAYVFWINESVPNSSIFASKPALAITVYGSVGPEAAYCGIPVLYAGDHPAINFKTGSTPTTKKEYFRLLRNKLDVISGSREEAILFMANHYEHVYTKYDRSLIGFMGVSWDQIDKNPSLLDSNLVDEYLRKQCIKLANILTNKTFQQV